jgi:hypothetical protein
MQINVQPQVFQGFNVAAGRSAEWATVWQQTLRNLRKLDRAAALGFGGIVDYRLALTGGNGNSRHT